MHETFCQIAVRAADAEQAERLAAKACAAGAAELEERECDSGITRILYAPAAVAEAVHDALAGAAPGIRIEPPTGVPDTDGSEAWKAGLTATIISPRLLIRPSAVSVVLGPGQAEIVIDPGQAFGTGGHPSTHLALDWIDELAPALKSGARILDVGTGTGILALAAECKSVGEALRVAGLRECGVRSRADPNGDPWSALLTTR